MRKFITRFRHLLTWQLAVFLGLLIIPTLLPLSRPNLTMLNLAGIFAIAAMGYNILLGISGQASLGHAALIGIGAYVSANLVALEIPLMGSLPFPLVLLISGLAATLVGVILGFPAIRLGGYYLAIATLGFGVVVQQIFAEWDTYTNGWSGMRVSSPEIFGFVLQQRIHYWYLVVVVIALMYLLGQNIIAGKVGRALKAMRDSSHAAQAMGVNIAYHKLIAFGISAFYAGVAGSLYAHLMRFIAPTDFNILMSLSLLSMVVVGGLATLPGGLVGAAFYQIMPIMVTKVPVKNFSFMLTGICLILVVMFLPFGLVSLPHKFKELVRGLKKRPTLPGKGS